MEQEWSRDGGNRTKSPVNQSGIHQSIHQHDDVATAAAPTANAAAAAVGGCKFAQSALSSISLDIINKVNKSMCHIREVAWLHLASDMTNSFSSIIINTFMISTEESIRIDNRRKRPIKISGNTRLFLEYFFEKIIYKFFQLC